MAKQFLRLLGFVGLLVLAAVAAVGCSKSKGGSTAVVTGKVTLPNGQPLTGGRIDFQSASDEKKTAGGMIKADGTYEATAVPLGECKVSITNASLKGLPTTTLASKDMPGSEREGEKYVPINPKYAKFATSGLSTNVEGKEHTYDITLQK
jgi:hypothetical protein